MSSTNNNSVYTLETPKERNMRMGMTAVLVAAFLGIGYFFLPTITKTIHNWIDFGVELSKLGLFAVILLTLWYLKDVLVARYQSMIRKITRALVRTDLPSLLEVVVANRRGVLDSFSDSIKKMMKAISLHEDKMKTRKKSMEDNLGRAKHFKERAADTSLSEHERQIAADQQRHFAKEAEADRQLLENMQKDKEKMLKSYNFFDRLYNNLVSSTDSVTNQIERLRDQLQTSETWRSAAESASKLLGVSEFETITLEETRNRIAENEAEVMMMIHDHERLLMKMEADNGIMDDAGQKLLEQYSNKTDVFAFMNTPATPGQTVSAMPGGDNTSWLNANEHLLGGGGGK